MPSFKALLLGSALFVQCLYTATAVPRQRPEGQPINAEAQADVQAFQKLLDQVDPTALHSALHQHSPTPFRDGIFKEDRTAAEALHRDNPPLATSIVAMAKRQEPGNNSSSVVVITSVNTVTAVDTTVTQSISPSSTPPNPVQSTEASTVPATSSAVPSPSSSPVASPSTPIIVGPSSTPPGGTIVVGGTTTVGGSTITATAGSTQPGGPVITSGASPSSASSLASGQIVTTTNAGGLTIVSTIGGGFVTLSGQSGSPATSGSASAGVSGSSAAGPGSETSVVFRTTTLPNGAQSTVTALTIVKGTETGVVTPSGTAGVAGGSSETTTGSPGLQTNLSPRSRSLGWEVMGALGGAVGFAMVL